MSLVLLIKILTALSYSLCLPIRERVSLSDSPIVLSLDSSILIVSTFGKSFIS